MKKHAQISNFSFRALGIGLCLLWLPACSTLSGSGGLSESQKRGNASWYGPRHDGKKTASGEVFRKDGLTAAHRTLPFGTYVKVTNLKNEREVTVRINDRGPYSAGRIIDVSEEAARRLDLIRQGVAPVYIDVVPKPFFAFD
jgi:rare lipoprotein A